MIKQAKALLAGVAIAVLSATAGAAPWDETIDPSPDLPVPPTRTWTHDLTTDGFLPGVDTITGFLLQVRLYDDSCDSRFCYFDLEAERAGINLPGNSFDIVTGEIDSGVYQTGGAISGSYVLNATGLLTVTLSSNTGDFMLDWSKLTAYGRDGNRVPEPATLGLLGLGLAGLALVRRRKRA